MLQSEQAASIQALLALVKSHPVEDSEESDTPDDSHLPNGQSLHCPERTCSGETYKDRNALERHYQSRT